MQLAEGRRHPEGGLRIIGHDISTSIRDSLPDYARDLKLNLGTVLTTQGAPGLNEKQIWSIALASAIASRNAAVRA